LYANAVTWCYKARRGTISIWALRRGTKDWQGTTDLWNPARRVQADGDGLVVELVAIEIKKVQQQLAEMVSSIQVAALNLWHHLQHTHHETDDREASDASVDGLVEAAHQEEVLDQRDQCRHARVLLAPCLECVDGRQPRAVLERDVNLEARLMLDELDQWHLGTENELNLVLPSDFVVH
jgi:hypothetical protein